jgi:cytochrome P450
MTEAFSLSQHACNAADVPLHLIDVSDPKLFQDDTIGQYFARLRREDPVHYRKDGMFGSFWSVTKYKDIMHVDINHEIFSSDVVKGGISIADRPMEERLPMFIAQDPPRHDVQRKTVSPIVAPGNLAAMEETIRTRTCRVLDGLPRNETFDWVDEVSIELTTQMLATLFDFPFEERRLLTWWSNVATSIPGVGGIIESEAAYRMELGKCLAYFGGLWNQRAHSPPRNDLISMLAHSPATKQIDQKEFLGNVLLLIVGGNDTTRNSMSGGLCAVLQNPGEYERLRGNPALISSMVPEIIRWQTPLAHMRRTALVDTELGGKLIRKGDKVIMWYLSGNRDEESIEDPDRFIINRVRPRQHLSFGFGIHRCVGNRLAELQLQILWEEMLQRFPAIELVGKPTRTLSNFVRGFTSMLVRLPG